MAQPLGRAQYHYGLMRYAKVDLPLPRATSRLSQSLSLVILSLFVVISEAEPKNLRPLHESLRWVGQLGCVIPSL
jgi:hypothetical protein